MADSLEEVLKEHRELCETASPGPWHIGHVSEVSEACDIQDPEGNDVCSVYNREDQVLICNIPELLPRYIKALEKAIEQRDQELRESVFRFYPPDKRHIAEIKIKEELDLELAAILGNSKGEDYG